MLLGAGRGLLVVFDVLLAIGRAVPVVVPQQRFRRPVPVLSCAWLLVDILLIVVDSMDLAAGLCGGSG